MPTMRERMARELGDLRAQAQFRTLDTPAGVNLISNDYLGLGTDPRLKEAAAKAVADAGATGGTGSRLLSGNAREWEEAEAEFARFAGTEAALYFGSGYAANVGLLSAVLKRGDTVFSDALNHASLIDGMRLSGAEKVVYPHRDLGFLESALRKRAGAPGAKVIVTETIFSMEGDLAPLGELAALARRYGAALALDEAHATGVCGAEGRGIAAEFARAPEILAIVHTCGKALGSAGAFVCGTTTLRDYLINRARTFIFSTAMPPYFAGQIRAALALARGAEDRRAHLREVAVLLRSELAARGFDCSRSESHIVPVILGSNEAAVHFAAELQRAGFAVRAIRPPTVPAGGARVRFSLTSRITHGEIRALAEALEAARASLPQALSAGAAVHA